MLEFARRWRGGAASGNRQPIQLVNAGKFYKGLPNQDQALEWLESKLTKHALSLFAKRWN